MIKSKRFHLIILSILSTLIFAHSISAQDNGEKLYRLFPTDFESIKNIEMQGVNVFNSSINNYIDIVATSEQIDNIKREIGRVEFLANDFAELVDHRLKSGSYEDYHNHQQTIDLLNQFANAFPEITMLDTIGYSNLGREICSIKISDNPEVDEDETPILMAGCHHGNEVLSVEATLYQIDFLLNNYGIDTEVTQWIDNMEIWYVPLVNPDGREAVRRYNDNDVDLNRNYSFGHTAGGSHGPSGFSEPETQAIRDLAAKYPPVLSLTYHTSGRLVLLAWTHTDDSAPDSLALSYVGNKVAESITFPSGSGTDHYELRQGGDWYFTAGEYCDYMYGTHHTYAFTVEMWTSQTPPADVIPQVVERNLEGMKTLLRQAGMAGITGQIKDKLTGEAMIARINFPFIDDQGKLPPQMSNEMFGRYYKYLVPGSYEMEITAPGYRTIRKEITIEDDTMLNLDLEMDPAPELQLKEFVLSDQSGNRISGNADGKVNIGETAGVFLTIYNDQQISAVGSYIKVSSPSPYVDLVTDSLYFGSIGHYSQVQSNDTLLFKLKPNCPDAAVLDFTLNIGDEISIAWKGEISFEAYAPNIGVKEVIINDDGGNQNGIIDKGETVTFALHLENNGRQNISEAQVTALISDPYFSFQTEAVQVSSLNTNESTEIEFQVSLSPDSPDIYSSYVTFHITSTEGYEEDIRVPIDNIFGFIDEFENGTNGWTHATYETTSNEHDDWQLGQPQGKAGDPSLAFSGNNCWGTDLGYELYENESWNGEYQNNVYNFLMSPPIDCSAMTGVGLRYRRWLNTKAMDIARIKVNDVVVWKSSNRGHSDQEWVEQVIDISEIADGNSEVIIKFELETSSANALGGWNIDDFLVANKLGTGTMGVDVREDFNSELLKCYPNPFSSSTTVEYQLDSYDHVELCVTDALGKRVRILVSEKQFPGIHAIRWDGDTDFDQVVKPGIYNISIVCGSEYSTKKVLLLR